jgi:single-stranded-DNA-specific exonuclease
MSTEAAMVASLLSFTGARWEPVAVARAAIDEVSRQHPDLSAVAARCLAIRMASVRAASPSWLAPELGDLHDPLQMRNMAEAVDRLRSALRRRERIRIITDYDVDGTTSSLILQAALRLVDPMAQVDYHIPDRFLEGYGFSVAAADAAADAGVGLIVTADIGVRDHAAVARARERGVSVLICDHHLPEGAAVPEGALVLCPPQEGCDYPNPALAACGISLKVAQAMLRTHERCDAVVMSLMKLAAIGTVADLVPITGQENRAIVALGLRELNRGRHSPGLAALIDAAGLTPGTIRDQDLGFRIAPRINAAGRVADARLVVDLLNCREPERARVYAQEIERLNSQRRDIQDRLAAGAVARVGDAPDPFVVVAGAEHEGWHRGVVGIVASKIKDKLNRPVAVVSIQGDRAVGSIRSTPGIHAVKALTSVRDLLEKFGGHPVAAGFTVPTARLDEFRERLCDYVRSHAGEGEETPVREVDAEIDAPRLDDALLRDLERLGPFGQGNPRPRLVVRGVRPRNMELKGDYRLLKFQIPQSERGDVAESGRYTWLDAVWWDAPDVVTRLGDGAVDLYGELMEHRYKGSRRLQLQVSDARPA